MTSPHHSLANGRYGGTTIRRVTVERGYSLNHAADREPAREAQNTGSGSAAAGALGLLLLLALAGAASSRSESERRRAEPPKPAPPPPPVVYVLPPGKRPHVVSYPPVRPALAMMDEKKLRVPLELALHAGVLLVVAFTGFGALCYVAGRGG